MRPQLVCVHTTADYRGDTVTVLGVPSARLLAVAGYNTPRQHVLGLITVRQHEEGPTTYTTSGHSGELADLEAAAAVLVEQRTRSSRSSGRWGPGVDDRRRAPPRSCARREFVAGPPLAEVAYEPFARPEIRRLEELRLDAIELAVARGVCRGRRIRAVARGRGGALQRWS